MSLVTLIVCELGFWVFLNRNTPFTTPRSDVLERIVVVTAAVGTLYVALSLAFHQPTRLDPVDTFWFTLVNIVIALVLVVRHRRTV